MNKYKLSELLKINNGKDYKHLDAGKVPVYGTGGIMTHVDDFLGNGESILLPRKGTLDNITYVNGKFWTVDTIYWTTINTDRAYPKYLYCYLSLLDLSHRDSGSALPSMTFDSYYSLDINLPDIETQAVVGDFVFSLIEQIKANNSICSDLEAAAKLLYDYWFVQFDFPDENGRPYKSSGGKMVWNDELKREIPAGWSAGRLEDLMRITMGQSPSGDSYNAENEGTVFFQGRAEFGDYYPRKNLYTTSPKRLANADDVLLSVRAPVGDINFAFEDCCIGRGLASIRDRCNCPLYAWFTAKSLSVYFKRAGSNGTTFGAIDKDGLAALPVVIPTAEARSAFASLANPIYEELREAESEILELSEARDFLLPLLMNGQVTIGGGGK